MKTSWLFFFVWSICSLEAAYQPTLYPQYACSGQKKATIEEWVNAQGDPSDVLSLLPRKAKRDYLCKLYDKNPQIITACLIGAIMHRRQKLIRLLLKTGVAVTSTYREEAPLKVAELFFKEIIPTLTKTQQITTGSS